MCPSLIQIGSKTAEKNSAQTNKTDKQTNKQTDRQTLRKQWSLGREPMRKNNQIITLITYGLMLIFPLLQVGSQRLLLGHQMRNL